MIASDSLATMVRETAGRSGGESLRAWATDLLRQVCRNRVVGDAWARDVPTWGFWGVPESSVDSQSSQWLHRVCCHGPHKNLSLFLAYAGLPMNGQRRPSEVGGSASGAHLFRGHFRVDFRDGSVTRSPSQDGFGDGLQVLDCSPPCRRCHRGLAFSLMGLSPTEGVSLRWMHNHTTLAQCRKSPCAAHAALWQRAVRENLSL
jgi:hypothetical protein